MLLYGTLLTPTGEPYSEAFIRLTARVTSDQVLSTTSSGFKTDVAGNYSFDCPIGRYTVNVYTGGRLQSIGNITITTSTTEPSITALMLLESIAQPGNPILDTIVEAASQAEASKDAAALSESSALASEEEAALKATQAAQQATTAQTQASLATTQAQAAQAAATAAASSQSNAALSATSASEIKDYVEDHVDELLIQIDAITADPSDAVTSWEIQAKGFDSVQGTATFGPITARLAAWSLPSGSASYLSIPLSLPAHWTKMDVYVKWVNLVANAGNVVLGGEVHQWAVGETINATPVGNSAVVAANPVPWIVVETKVGSDLILNPAKMTTLRIARQGASGSNTLLNGIGLLSVRLQKKA